MSVSIKGQGLPTEEQIADFREAFRLLGMNEDGTLPPSAIDALRSVSGSGIIDSSCMFYIPGRQFVGSGNPKDLSGNGADAVIGTGTSDAAVWARTYQRTVTADAGSIAANTTAEFALTVSGATVGMPVFVAKTTHVAGLSVTQARISAANTVTVTLANNTGSAIDPASDTWAVWSPNLTVSSQGMSAAGTPSVPVNGGGLYIPLNKSNFNLASESVVFAAQLVFDNPSGAVSVFGNGAVAADGFYLSARPGGFFKPVLRIGGVQAALADGTTVFCDGTPHNVIMATDCITGEVKVFRDGALCHAYAANSFSRAAASVPTSTFTIGGQTGASAPAYGGQYAGVQLYRKAGVGLPSNLALLAAKLAANPTGFLEQGSILW